MSKPYRIGLSSISPSQANERQKAVLESAQRQVGFIPNMYANMVNAPAMLETYLFGYALFRKESGFSPAEQEVVFLAISRTNECHYCMGAHSFIADAVSGVPPAVTDALRNDTPIPDPRLAALATFSRLMVEKRGVPSEADVQPFLEAGYSESQILHILLAISVKTLSNYSNHLFNTPLDNRFAKRAWP